MAIEYTIYYRGAPEDLRAAMDETLPPRCFAHVSTGPTRPLDRLRARLGPDKSLFLFQNETELPPPR